MEEANKLMADDDEDEQPAQSAQEETGPKIKMGRIGKKSKKSAAAASATSGENYTKKLTAAAALDGPSGKGSFSETDIEFMKKAI